MSEAGISRRPSRSLPALVAPLRDGWRQSQAILAEMFEVPVSFGEPVVDEKMGAAFVADDRVSAVGMSFAGDADGLALLLVSRSAVQPLVVALLGGADADPDEVLAFYPTTVVELGNVVLNSVVAEVGRALDETYRFELPALLSQRELAERLDSAAGGIVLVGEATVGREPASPLGIGLLLDEGPRTRHV